MKAKGLAVPTVWLLSAVLPLSGGTSVKLTATFIPPDEVRLSWPCTAGQSYQLKSATDLGGQWTTYTTDPDILPAHGEELSVTVPAADAVRFFRAVELPDEPEPEPGMAWIPPGMFLMGSPDTESGRHTDEGPQTQVTISRGFWLGRYEVTQTEYLGVRGVNPSWFKGDLGLPVESVVWDDALAYCEELTQQERTAGRLPEGWEYRLPTEAQWEYACRAGTTTRFSLGDAPACNNDSNCSFCAEMDQHMVWCANGNGRTQQVGTRLPNSWGLYDMHGNVGEWCADRYADSYLGGGVTDPTGPTTGSDRVLRGGAWNFEAQYCRSASRYPVDPSTLAGANVGFRVALVPVP